MSGSVKFSWISSTNGVNIYYMLCSPDIYNGDYQTELTHFTTYTSAIISGFQEGRGYVCTLTAMHEDGSQMEESIRVRFLGKQHN